MEITPQLLNFTGVDHLVKNIIRIPSLALDAQVVAPQDLLVLHVTHPLKMINDPFIKVVTPVCERVSEHSSRFALSGRTSMSDKSNGIRESNSLS